jgi:hypothetical protein
MCTEVLGDRARHQIDPQLACGLPRPGDRAALERLGSGSQILRAAHNRPLLGQHDQRGALIRGGAHVFIGGGDVRLHVRTRIELDNR